MCAHLHTKFNPEAAAASPWCMTARGLSLFGAAPIKLQISFLFLQATDGGGRSDPDEKVSVTNCQMYIFIVPL